MLRDKKVTKVFVTNDLDGEIPVKEGTECTVISETIDEARISFTQWPKSEETRVVPKFCLAIDTIHLLDIMLE